MRRQASTVDGEHGRDQQEGHVAAADERSAGADRVAAAGGGAVRAAARLPLLRVDGARPDHHHRDDHVHLPARRARGGADLAARQLGAPAEGGHDER